jgi:hypothetical protein
MASRGLLSAAAFGKSRCVWEVVVKGSPRGMRDAISQAEVLLSKRFRITTADAYALLLRLSARQELPVRSAAEQLVDERHASTTGRFLEQ